MIFFQKIINPKTIPLSENSALDRLGLFSSLEKSFNIAVKVKRLSNLNALAMALRTDGSAYLRIADSNRHIIVDAIDKQVAPLRVPFHAWAITVPRAALRFALAPALAAPEREYDLKSLKEIEEYIKAFKHLPDVPTAQEFEKEGINLSSFNMLLLKKIEELTLYIIEQNNEIKSLKESNANLNKRLLAIED